MKKQRASRQIKKKRGKRPRQAKGKKFFLALNRLKRLKSGQQREALQHANDAFIRQMCTQVKKLRHTTLPLALAKRMQRQKKILNKFVLPKTSTRVKRKILTQRGGAILPLLLTALPAIGSMVGNLLGGMRKRRS